MPRYSVRSQTPVQSYESGRITWTPGGTMNMDDCYIDDSTVETLGNDDRRGVWLRLIGPDEARLTRNTSRWVFMPSEAALEIARNIHREAINNLAMHDEREANDGT